MCNNYCICFKYCNYENGLNPGVTYLDWKRSYGWLESWEGVLLVTNVSTTARKPFFRVNWAKLPLRNPKNFLFYDFQSLWKVMATYPLISVFVYIFLFAGYEPSTERIFHQLLPQYISDRAPVERSFKSGGICQGTTSGLSLCWIRLLGWTR